MKTSLRPPGRRRAAAFGRRSPPPPGRLRLASALALAAALAGLPPARAASAQSTTLEQVGRLDAPAALVELAGDFAYVAAGETLRVVNVSDPARPAAQGKFAAPGTIWAVHAAPPHVYLTAGTEGMYVVDVSDPQAPALAGTHRTAGQALGVTTSGPIAAVVNLMTGLEIVDVSDRAAPALVETRETPGYQWAVDGAGSNVLVVDQPSGVHLFDVSNPQSSVEQGVYVTEQPAQAVTAGAGGRAYVTYAGAGLVEILDVANPADPRRAGSYRPARSSGRFQRVAVDRFDMVVPVGEDGIELVDVSDPAAPVRLASCDTPGDAQSAAIRGSLIAVADGDALLLFRIR